MWKTGFIVGCALGSLVALLSWLATSHTAESQPTSPPSKPPSPPRLRLVQGRSWKLSLDGLAASTPRYESVDAWGPIDDAGRLVWCLDVSVRLESNAIVKGVDVWLVRQFTGSTPSRVPDFAVVDSMEPLEPLVETWQVRPIPYPATVVVRNTGGAITSGELTITEQVVEVY